MPSHSPNYIPKANASDLQGRFEEILSDPNNAFIPRCEGAGEVSDGLLTMHNGLRLPPDYYGGFSKVLELNQGVHEPQEERVFLEVLQDMPTGATMIELGAYWAFYSMWFNAVVPQARNYVFEPEAVHLECGVRNFELNGLHAEFFQQGVGPDGVDLVEFVTERKIDLVDLLHVDIQGAEFQLINMIEPLLYERRINYLFISTHGQALHYYCRDKLEAAGYLILASADFEHETYCYDGVLVARDANRPGIHPIPIDVRNTGKWD